MSDEVTPVLPLPIPLDHLLRAETVECARVEYKKTWDEFIRRSVLKTICAFANDLINENGGYIVLGVEEQEGHPILPPQGLDELNIDQIQKEIRGQCQRLNPQYQPMLFPVVRDGRQLLVIHAQGGDYRPYQAPCGKDDKERAYFVRVGSETIEAQGTLLTTLMQQTARIPFDDQRRFDCSLDDISGELVRKYLHDIGSDLARSAYSTSELLRHMRLSARSNGHEVPRNVALLFFTLNPEVFFPGARIEIAQFGDDAGGDLIEEKYIRGPLSTQIRDTLAALENLVMSHTRKIPGQAEAQRFVSYPYEALEEAIANAVLHRSYEQQSEPVKVYLYPDRLEVISYPGPVPGLRVEDLAPNARPNHPPPRNRRIGEMLKELRLAELRSTGIPKIRRRMKEIGSPEPTFEFDEDRTWFRVTLPAHPEYVALAALRDSATLWATGARDAAINRLRIATRHLPTSGALLAQLIEYCATDNDLAAARSAFTSSLGPQRMRDGHLPALALARAISDASPNDPRSSDEVREILASAPMPNVAADHLEWALLYKRNRDYEKAHGIFQAAYSDLKNNAKALHEFAQVKLALSKKTSGPHRKAASQRLINEAVSMLHQVIQLSDDATRKAWAWFDLSKALGARQAPQSEIDNAIASARQLAPNEPRFSPLESD